MSLQNSIRYTRRYLKRFPNTLYPKETLANLGISAGPTKAASPNHQPDQVATPFYLSYRIPKSQTTCSQTLLSNLTELNGDATREKGSSVPGEDEEIMKDMKSFEQESNQLLKTVEGFWGSALQKGQVAMDQHLNDQHKQFNKLPLSQNHPRQILLELKLLKQAHQQRLRGVNNPEVHHEGHDAALVLVTPGLSGLIGQESFEKAILGLWPEDARDLDQYHIVTAVVDGTHFADEDSSSTSEGISVIRGSKCVMFPGLWEAREARETEVKDDVGALTFDIGDVSTVTVPLANTLFHNGKMSTLRATRVSGSDSIESKDLFEQRIKLPSTVGKGMTGPNSSVPNLRLPLEPVTELRTAKESFGNILRRIEISGKSEPASIELEKAVTQIQDLIATRAQELGIEFSGVWAVVFENEKGHIPTWNVETRSPHDKSSSIIGSMLTNPLQLDKPSFAPNALKGRPFKLLSGGGGWGDKAGLLALDPQTSHFAKSEEEMSQSLFGNDGGSTYIPDGATVQFYISNESPPPELDQRREYIRRGSSSLLNYSDANSYRDPEDVQEPEKEPYYGTDGVPRLLFGVGSRLPAPKDHDTEMSLHIGEFGVVSNKAIYVAEPETQDSLKHREAEYAPRIKPMKLDMPGAEVQIFNW